MGGGDCNIMGAFSGGGGGLTQNTQTDNIQADFTTTSSSYVTTGLSLTLSNESGGNATVTCGGQWRNDTASFDVQGTITDDGVAIVDSGRLYAGHAAVGTQTIASTTHLSTDGSVIDWRIRVSGGGTAYLLTAGGTAYVCAMVIKELY